MTESKARVTLSLVQCMVCTDGSVLIALGLCFDLEVHGRGDGTFVFPELRA